MLIIIPMLVTHRRTPVPPAVTVKCPPLQGKTQYGTHSNIICSGPGGSIKCTFTKYGIQTYFRSNRTLKQMLVRPKNQDPKEKKNEVIYSYQCGAIDCGEEYISVTSRTLGEKYKDYLREPSPIQVHSQLTGHQLSPDNFNIIGREGQDLTRLIKESIYIRVNNPTLNRNIG